MAVSFPTLNFHNWGGFAVGAALGDIPQCSSLYRHIGFAEFANLSGTGGAKKLANAGKLSSTNREKASKVVKIDFALERILSLRVMRWGRLRVRRRGILRRRGIMFLYL